MQITAGIRSSGTNHGNPNSELQAAIKEISSGRAPNNCSPLSTEYSHALGGHSSTTLPLSPLQKLYRCIALMMNNHPTSSFNTTTMNVDSIKLEQSPHLGCSSKLVVAGEPVSSSNEKGFSLVAGLFDDTQLLGTAEKNNDNIIIALPHGRKAILYPDGAIYTGGVVNWKRDGIGTMTYPNDQGTFTGSFVDGKIHSGRLISKNNTPLFFENGKLRNKWGEVTFTDHNSNNNSNKFYGTFVRGVMYDGVLVSEGKIPLELEGGKKKVVKQIEFPDGGIFIGSVDTDGKMKNGMIIIKDQLPLFFENGGLKSGKGAVVYPNGDVYAGNFKDGRRLTGNIYCKNGDQLNVLFSYGSLHHVYLKVDGQHLHLELPGRLKLKIAPEELPEVCNDYFIRAVVKRAIAGECDPSFVHCYVERFVPVSVCPELELAKITTYYKELKAVSMKISDLGKLPSPVIDFGDEEILSPETDIIVIKAPEDKPLEIFSMKYILQIMAIYMENLIKKRPANPDYLRSPLSKIEVMPNIVLKKDIGKYADLFNTFHYTPIGESVESVGKFPDDFPVPPLAAPHHHPNTPPTATTTAPHFTDMTLPSW